MANEGDIAAQRRLGRAIRALRDERGISRRDLEKATGLSYPYLSEIEAGKKSPSSKTLRVIADALDFGVHEFWQTAETGKESWERQAKKASPFHEAPRMFALEAPSSEPIPRGRQNLPTAAKKTSSRSGQQPDPTVGGYPPEDTDPRRGRPSEEFSRERALSRLAHIVNDLSPEDLGLLIRLATRLRRSSGRVRRRTEL
jgi:transcriptional regulator with XRE-family HTH domain